jgi:hypothetical protein
VVLRFKFDKLEEQMGDYWKQRAHIKWLEKGDCNTTYFHKAFTERKRKNRIGKIKNQNGYWVEDEGEKHNFITNHFVQLFQSVAHGDSEQLLDVVVPRVTREMNAELCEDFGEEEIKKVLDSIDDLGTGSR